MFGIIYENEIHKRWTSEYIFSDFKEAKEYLISEGFVEKNRTFERKDYNWSKYIKAYIEPKKLHTKA